jgi:hypothetical protein
MIYEINNKYLTSIGDYVYTFIDFDFVELLAPLRRFFVYPDPMGSEEPSPALLASSAQPKSIYSPWGWGK